MACGAGRVLADQIAGRSPQIKADDFNLHRYQ
jgi:glycine/D-amino acid oxidase-like deaminating enzyme